MMHPDFIKHQQDFSELSYRIHDEIKEMKKEVRKEKAMESLGNLLESMKSGREMPEEEEESDSYLEDSSGD